MKIKLVMTFIISLIFLGNILIAQEKFDYQWVVGYPQNDTTLSNYGAYLMDFNDNILKLIKETKATLRTFVSTASICDKNGKLAMYSNGCQIHNGDFELIEGCENINPGNAWDNYCNDFTFASYPTIQSQIILPIPEEENQYIYLTHKKEFSQKYFDDNYYTEFYNCTVIDMSLNNGKGKSKDNYIIEYPDNVKGYNLSACKHANGKDWWIINLSYNSKKFYRLLLTKNGISGPWEQLNGPERDTLDELGQSVFSPDGKKYACIYLASGKAWIMNFDRNTGLFSNLQILDFETKKDWHLRGVAFSPNNKYLYVAADYFLYQYNTDTSDVQSSKILIDSNDGYGLPDWPYFITFGIEQLGPDGKIYIGQLLGSLRQWSIINKPDEKGIACDFKQHSLLFPVYSIPTPPIQPNFRLGPDTTTSIKQIPIYQVEMKSWYNSSFKIIKCWLQHLPQEKGFYNITVNDITGRTLKSLKITNPQYQEDISLDGSALVPGVYIVNFIDHGRVLVSRKLFIY